jgi:hypothetical protein
MAAGAKRAEGGARADKAGVESESKKLIKKQTKIIKGDGKNG